MKLENQVVSLDLAKRLTELGVRQESLWIWTLVGEKYDDYSTVLVLNLQKTRFAALDWCPAYTVAELGEMLPEEIERGERSYWLQIGRGLGNEWVVGYRKNGTATMFFTQSESTEADARAKMLIYLLENKLITI